MIENIVRFELPKEVPDGYYRFPVKLLSIEGLPPEYATVIIYGRKVKLSLSLVRFGYYEGTECLHYKGKLACDIPSEIAKVHILNHMSGLDDLKYM